MLSILTSRTNAWISKRLPITVLRAFYRIGSITKFDCSTAILATLSTAKRFTLYVLARLRQRSSLHTMDCQAILAMYICNCMRVYYAQLKFLAIFWHTPTPHSAVHHNHVLSQDAMTDETADYLWTHNDSDDERSPAPPTPAQDQGHQKQANPPAAGHQAWSRPAQRSPLGR